MGGSLGRVRCRILFDKTNVFLTHWGGEEVGEGIIVWGVGWLLAASLED